MKNLAAELMERKRLQLYRSRQTLESPQGVLVRIDGCEYLSFCSNDYLGLANHPQLIEAFKDGADRFGVGSGAAHLITGHSYAHQALEEDLAEFVGMPRVLLFSTGYMANMGVVSTLARRGDIVYEDRLNHASLVDAARLGGAKLVRYPHLDVARLTAKLSAQSQGIRLIASDGVFSMDGDCAPVVELNREAKRSDAWLLIDDAHGFGVLGRDGRGWCAEQISTPAHNLILMATLGKAVGTFGAFVAGSEQLVETLIQQARTFIYTTAPPPAVAWATRTALQLVRDAQRLREHLSHLIERFRAGAAQLDLPLLPSATPIQPLVVGDAGLALQLSTTLREHGILVTAIRPPTVPEGTARLRITLSAEHRNEHIDRLLDTLHAVYRDCRHAAR